MSAIFFTGFPGFLGTELLTRILLQEPDQRAICLVQAKFSSLAASRLATIQESQPSLLGRVKLVEGDICQPDLGLNDPISIKQQTHEIFHLAALYDIRVGHDLATRVNVDGTQYVLDFAEGISQLNRFQYVSTCYVSGRHPGEFAEHELDCGQTFNNAYEATKYQAEVEVQRRMRGGLPTTIYRPSIVVGDSRTGETQKYDGPYFVIRWILRQPFLAIFPVFGQPAQTRVNLVPRDFVVNAITHLSRQSESTSKVYQLADPDPPTVDEFISLIASVTNHRILRIPMPIAAARFAIQRVPGIERLMRVPAATLDYFVHPTHYRCDNTLHDLASSNLTVPSLSSYLDRLVDFVKRHPQISSQPMA